MSASLLAAQSATLASQGSRSSAEEKPLWSLQPVRKPSLPEVRRADWTGTPIDRFILASLEKRGLSPSPPASKRDLIRRVTFDLTGLPPSESQVRDFLGDSAPDAYERLVDRLLSSPRYGERFAQHWLDVVRFAETEGFEYDRLIAGAWRYRDYVIEAFDRDKPFDQFLTEQIAGDELFPDDPECRTAAIFHRLGPVRRNAGNPEIALSRNEVLTERTDILGSAFLGLTVGCARCHDHKFDPISQKDYYRLQAYMAASQEDDVLLVSEERKRDWEEKLKSVRERIKTLSKEADAADGELRRKLRMEIEALERPLPGQPAGIPSVKNDLGQRTPIHVLKRGEWERKGEGVGPRPPSALIGAAVAELPGDSAHPRTALARWMADPAHPLTGRVAVNRVWQWHFGAGIVGTPNDFGSHGGRVSHPELLDWLANEFVRGGWRIKPIQRLILLSNVYRQASGLAGAEAERIDPENQLLSRFPRRRLSAEEIRDAMLFAAGVLNEKRGGPGVMTEVDPELVSLLYKPSQWLMEKDPREHQRRSVYLVAKRNLRLPFMEVFDQPALLTSCGRRESSTHAPQSLELMNGRLANDLAKRFAQRLRDEARGAAGHPIERASVLALGRPPTPSERRLAETFLAGQPLEELALAMFNLNEFLYVP